MIPRQKRDINGDLKTVDCVGREIEYSPIPWFLRRDPKKAREEMEEENKIRPIDREPDRAATLG